MERQDCLRLFLCQNVKKHAGAKHLFVQLEYGPEQVGLEVRDDGPALNVDEN